MKVLILSTYEKAGGAAIAASRLANALRKSGVEVSMLCRRNDVGKQSWTSIMERLLIWICRGFSKRGLWAVDIALLGQDITQTKEYREADVVHLHWVNQGFLSLGNVRQFVRDGKRVVWTMHDAWNTMGCYHIASQRGEKAGWLERCCLRRKVRLYSLGGIDFVACSEWLRGEFMRSSLTQALPVRAIPNPIDTDVFKPLPRKAVHTSPQPSPKERELLLSCAPVGAQAQSGTCYGKPTSWSGKRSSASDFSPLGGVRGGLNPSYHRRITGRILFVAQNVNNPMKGIAYLEEAVRLLQSNGGEAVEMIALGRDIPYIDNEEEMARLYNSVDAFVLPSLSENLPNTIMEAMACGVPCVGFDVGGIPEMIDHRRNGYVARLKDARDLAEGIRYVLDPENRERLGRAAREKVVQCYSEEAVARKYMEVYDG